ncbi:uncharacterized protein F5147DRAFT_744532 [Suillus discolor]|uniref:Uncharacterized protein n=1 Tax=Suillus discolor TaxID=1912936 RepID=A0A9P7FCT2_9AGAM|nr:uncharacterized protein F5147DRAFT_744532 [Suillus discolor]KAG2112213.1 hypothetical protein F5147DRAFT_744532 [Suillus discolor]
MSFTHLVLTHSAGRKCDIHGNFIDQNAPPPSRTEASPTDWMPYVNQVAFETAEFLYTHNQMSAAQIDTLLDLWAATLIRHNDSPLFTGHRDLYETIDSTPLGDVAWETGVKPAEEILLWMTDKYDVWFHDPRLLVHHMLSNPDFDTEIEYDPYRDYTNNDQCCYKNFFSGDWAWKQADIIAEDPETHGSTFVPLIIGSNKTTVSVATGHTEYHPLYMLIGNISNGVRRAHHNGVVLVGFLAIPKSTKEHLDDKDFHNFCHQMFHSSLAKIFESVKLNMMIPDTVRCPNSHYQCIIYGLGPYIANYPEQLMLSGVVQNWCPKCLNHHKNLDSDGPSLLQCQEHTDLLVQELQHVHLWHKYGIIQEVVVSDIHKLISLDILHQIIKGMFKYHLVDWVEEYLLLTHRASCAAEIMDDIDQRIAAIAPFAGLRCFPQGCGFKQWTGDDSKALIKVYIPAIKGHVPQDVIHTFSAFLDFCYIDDLTQLQDALNHFHQYRQIFKMTGVVPDFSLPHQHSINHYFLVIQLFGAPNGLCLSITELKHIKAIKEPWCRSSRYKALGQMLLTNQCLNKIAASIEVDTAEIVDGPPVQAHVELAALAIPGGTCNISALALKLELPNFPTMVQQFLYDQLHVGDHEAPDFNPVHDCIFVSTNKEVNCGLDGLAITRVLCFLVICWFSYVTDSQNPDTGMYIVVPSTNDDGMPDISLIHIDCIFHAAHLIPLYGTDSLPREITPHDSYNVFCTFTINKYANHHVFEVA